MNKKLFGLSTTALAAALALAGCSAGSGSGAAGTSAPGSSSASAAASATTPAAGEHNAADTMFARMMIPHHAQAVEMSDMMLKKQDIPAEVTALATRIKAAQGPEIAKMTGWLNNWNEPTQVPSGHSMDGSMDGMMGGADLKKLDAARGTDAAKLFLTQMTAHHEGAVKMAQTETTGGKYPDAVRLSKDIVASQETEIQEMRDLLATL